MSRRVVKASVANVQTIETAINQIGKPFVPRQDPFAELQSEIENCRRKIWECLGEPENSQPHAKRVKSETIVEAPSVVEAQPESSKAYITKNSSNRAEIEFKVNAMKVVQMREECRKLGLDNKGVKKVLRSRLLEHLLSDANRQPDSPPQDSSEVQQEMTEVSASKSGETNEQNDGNEMKIDDIAIKQESTESEKEDSRMPITSTQAEPKMSTKEPEPSAPQEVDMQTSNASAPENEMNATIVPKTSKVKPQTKDRINGGQQTAVREDYYKDSIPEDDVSLPASDVTTSTVSSKISGTKVRELVSKLSNKSQYTSGTPSSSAPSGSALSKSVQAKKDARMARMAEIREKSQHAKSFKAGQTGFSGKELATSLNPTLGSSSMNSTLKSFTGKKNLAAQMREKALRKENAPANHQVVVAPTQTKRAFPLNQSNVADTLGATLKTGLGSTLKYGMSAAAKVAKVASPMETYEISDREDSDSDSDSDAENEKKKKKIPLWAKKENLLPALEQQYLGKALDGKRVDPDDIFPEVESCNLEAIFGSKKNSRYRSRTSSGNWSRDQVTAAEKLVYKRTMGFAVETSEI